MRRRDAGDAALAASRKVGSGFVKPTGLFRDTGPLSWDAACSYGGDRPAHRRTSDGKSEMTASRKLELWAALAVTAMGAVGLTFGVSVSLAAPIEQGRFDEQSSWIERRYCGDLRVLIDYHDQGVFVGRPAGQERFLRYTVSHHGSDPHQSRKRASVHLRLELPGTGDRSHETAMAPSASSPSYRGPRRSMARTASWCQPTAARCGS